MGGQPRGEPGGPGARRKMIPPASEATQSLQPVRMPRDGVTWQGARPRGPSEGDGPQPAVYRWARSPRRGVVNGIARARPWPRRRNETHEPQHPMTWHNKVMWTEGMFLRPQHFQQQDRFAGRQLDDVVLERSGRFRVAQAARPPPVPSPNNRPQPAPTRTRVVMVSPRRIRGEESEFVRLFYRRYSNELIMGP